jgi:hypothetical protein
MLSLTALPVLRPRLVELGVSGSVRSVPPVAADVVTAESALAEALRRGDATAKGDLYFR